MEAFAQKLFETHSESAGGGHFKTADAVYVLAFSTIILNTDLHNPNLNPQKKMSMKQFVSNNRGINDNADIPQEYLQQLYRDIQGKQIQVDLELADMVDGDGSAAQGAAAGLLSDKNSWAKLLDKGQNQAPAAFTPTVSARQGYNTGAAYSRERGRSYSGHAHLSGLAGRTGLVPLSSATHGLKASANPQDRDMFSVMAAPVLDAIFCVWNGLPHTAVQQDSATNYAAYSSSAGGLDAWMAAAQQAERSAGHNRSGVETDDVTTGKLVAGYVNTPIRTYNSTNIRLYLHIHILITTPIHLHTYIYRVVDFAEICVSLELTKQLTLLVKVLAVTARRLLETAQHTRELAEIGQMTSLAGKQIQRGLSHLLGQGFCSALSQGDTRTSGPKSGHKQWSQGWAGARLIRGELALRYVGICGHAERCMDAGYSVPKRD